VSFKFRPLLLCTILSIAGLFFLAAPCRAQLGEPTQLATIAATVATAATCTGTAQNFTTAQSIPNFRNIGQTSHLATATSNAATFQMEIDGIDNLGNVFRLSDLQVGVPTSAKGGMVVTASGYMPNIQISVTCSAGATFSVSYSGSYSPQPPNVAGALLVAVDKLPFQTAAANTTASTTFQTPGGSSQGTIVFQYSAAGPAGSTISAQCLTNSGQNLGQPFTYALTTATTPQFFSVTQTTCPFVSLTYASGGASAVTYNLEFIFSVQGQQATLSTQNSGPSSTTATQVVSDALSQAFVAQNNVVTNPINGQAALFVNANNGARSIYFDKAVISCSAACQINIDPITSIGITCGSQPIVNQKIAAGVSSTAIDGFTCTTNPNTTFGIAVQNFNIPANGSLVLDLRGFIAPALTTTGLMIQMGAGLTGTISASFFWYEK
jgi:hypothetical protein